MNDIVLICVWSESIAWLLEFRWNGFEAIVWICQKNQWVCEFSL